MRCIWLTILASCTPDEPSDRPPDTDADADADADADSDSDSDTDAVVVSASCEPATNPLRVACAATLATPGTATLDLSATGLPTRSFSSTDATEHTFGGWGLVENTEYTWTIGSISGTVTTGALPQALAEAAIAVTGTSWGFDAVLWPMSCPGPADYFTLIDGEGRIVWFEANDVYFDGTFTGYDWSQESLTVLSVNADRFLEQHVTDGPVLELLGDGVDFEHTLHHDVDRWGDLRFLLFEYPVGGQQVDGVHVFDGSTLLDTFFLGDHFQVPPQGQGDWTHGNAIKVTDTGEIVLSIHTFDSIVALDGEPASPTFLDLVWTANGSADGLSPEPDYVPVAGATEGFERQHNTSRHGDDLWVFDNASQPESRAVRLAMDHGAGTLAVTGSWSFDTTCSNQGGAIPLEGGGVLATCANDAKAWAFEETATTPSWTIDARCGPDGGAGTLPILRAIPVRIE